MFACCAMSEAGTSTGFSFSPAISSKEGRLCTWYFRFSPPRIIHATPTPIRTRAIAGVGPPCGATKLQPIPTISSAIPMVRFFIHCAPFCLGGLSSDRGVPLSMAASICLCSSRFLMTYTMQTAMTGTKHPSNIIVTPKAS